MNRYRSLPGVGPNASKATAQTTCQKCLKKGHYSYECKATLQDRPYASRPSRTQVLRNPKLAREVDTSTAASGSGVGENGAGVADQVLKEREDARRGDSGFTNGNAEENRGRSRSSSLDSVSTISTDDDRDRSPRSRPRPFNDRTNRRSPSPNRSPRKRRFSSVSSASTSRSPVRPGSHRKNRRHRTISPDDRGRPHSYRRGSRRSRSGSAGKSMDKSRITKQRRGLEDDGDEAVMDDEDDEDDERRGGGRDRRGQKDSYVERSDRRGHDTSFANRRGREDGDLTGRGGGRDGRGGEQGRRKERSLSPYSRRLAMTQAMNMER
jgi:hypothetical protein